MTIEEAIKHCKAKENCTECGKEHGQLRQWLEELQILRNKATPKRPRQNECPNCKKFVPILHICDEVRDNKTTYCQYCGQAITWEEENGN